MNVGTCVARLLVTVVVCWRSSSNSSSSSTYICQQTSIRTLKTLRTAGYQEGKRSSRLAA